MANPANLLVIAPDHIDRNLGGPPPALQNQNSDVDVLQSAELAVRKSQTIA